ncbi:hypothetical protein BC332_21923 [Capsicum chinense]|nr:hypothetical protein BC332_21923 [Capsicum chinense]
MSAKVLKRKHFQIENRMEATGIHLPEQIVEEILSRLPLRSLLRFKCLSKIWEALILDPYFHKMMMHQSPDSNSQKLLIRKMFGDTAPSRFKFYSSSLSTFEDVQQLDPPLTHYVGRYHIFSSFDGLVLLAADTQLFLWNPLTRETVLLPYTEYNIIYTSFGLGYDDATDGYKILKLNMRLKHSMEILTLKTGFWREICNHPTAVCPRTGYEMELLPLPSKHIPMEPLVYVHGAFHWIGDLMLWAMKDYGVKESWIVLCTLQFNGFAIAKPRYRFPDGELLLYAPGEFPHQCGIPGIVEVENISYDVELISALVERWRPETHTFYLRIGEATITLQDIEIMFGMVVDGSPIILEDSIDLGIAARRQMMRDLTGWESPLDCFCGIRIILVSKLAAYVKELDDINDDTPEIEVQRRVRLGCPYFFGINGTRLSFAPNYVPPNQSTESPPVQVRRHGRQSASRDSMHQGRRDGRRADSMADRSEEPHDNFGCL